MLATIALLPPILALLAAAAPSPTVPPRSTIKWAGAPGLFFEFEQIFTSPIYTPTPIQNGIKPYFFCRAWQISGQIAVTGTLGEPPGNGARVHMWDCYDGLTQQQWVVEGSQIRLRNYDLCLDVPDGQPGRNFVQVWECGLWLLSDLRSGGQAAWLQQAATR
ncbi:hypothetical protein CC85DRAFT_200372 [Cutaneotrichosporon oleaginosum]|uniref:Ricin B lectin domain-containing protein n=1 Tax=Cutaneotrichosporon oleaginosum TaxID=879819 RepID=A0A0J1AVE8_9TREE|nr:uncharacterized protein CC85DRAFT_200372 [Cutaneotrichosporon oleaginosum]KLT39264.1 hypothetical protein CC85DRAFT_200372 [Cutaneotrichosporon oleaginosum]TXT09626.1 hypothetical protein COLE_03560 [Cutaneotrichosporon oleaginosum]